MTLANKITILRILIVPLFVLQMIYYVTPFAPGEGALWHLWFAIALFAVAAISDGVDGYIARRYNQKTTLGTILDPIADKLLLVSALIMLSIGRDAFLPNWLPLWFPVLVISRELILAFGTSVLQMMGVTVVVHPRVIGKMATFLQMVTLGWVFVKIPSVHLFWISHTEVTLFHVPLVLAGLCTFISGLWYVADGSRQLADSQISH
jgi:cardiolipin synthase